jgi:hypothetical protein
LENFFDKVKKNVSQSKKKKKLKAEKLDENGNQIDPPGFQLITLPYADEIRPIPPTVENMEGNTIVFLGCQL